uniref:Uncharacterized protein n=1 Tax=Triticum urartu TaxID=4572 RepID=A0A8R7Q288_TRIUA
PTRPCPSSRPQPTTAARGTSSPALAGCSCLRHPPLAPRTSYTHPRNLHRPPPLARHCATTSLACPPRPLLTPLPWIGSGDLKVPDRPSSPAPAGGLPCLTRPRRPRRHRPSPATTPAGPAPTIESRRCSISSTPPPPSWRNSCPALTRMGSSTDKSFHKVHRMAV